VAAASRHVSCQSLCIDDGYREAAMLELQFHAEMFARLVVATTLGALVGIEREQVGKPAGVRTHGMVALGAALFTVVSRDGFGAGDPSRIAAQVVTGVGFLGAGAIIQTRGSVHGLTTAASLWVTAALGVSVGVGMFVMSLETTILVYLLLRFGPRPAARTMADGESAAPHGETA
jgi:putative Mg2+ transporter-C (MgtC) family protein